MSLKGNLETFFLSSVLQLLCNDKKTGVLQVSENENNIKVYLNEGSIIYAMGSQKENRLGYLLQSKGIISAKDLQKCLQVAKEKNQQLGKILVENEFVSLENLKNIIQQQVENILYGLFLWEKGDFEYKDARLNLKGVVVTPINTMELVLEASRRIDEMSILTKQIPSDKLVFKISEKVQDQEEIKLNSNEWRILSLIDGRRTVREVINKSGYDELAAFKLLYSIISSGFIEKSEEVIIEEEDQTGEKEDSVDYSEIITDLVTIYSDILQAIRKSLEDEIGNQVFTIFDECKDELFSQQKDLLKNFHLKNSVDTNIQVVLEAMDSFKDYKEGWAFLTISFNDILFNLLNKGRSILGAQPIQKTLREIEEVISYVNKYQKSSPEKIQIVNNIRSVLQKAGAEQ